MAIPAIPVWTIPPNWANPVVERLSWLTDVMTSRSGAEQRRGVRLTPRRSFEFKINPFDNIRTFADLWLHNIGDEECFLPLWHDHATMTAAAVLGAVRIDFGNVYREFIAGGFALIYSDPFTWEVVEIASQDAIGIDLAGATFNAWPSGTSVYPLRLAFLDPEVTSRALSSRVGEITLEFAINEANDFDGGAETLTTYGGFPVITIEPNRMENLETQYRRIMDELDLRIGKRSRYDEGGRAFQTQFYNWRVKGRAERYALRQLLYRLNGRQKAVWLPSFNDDLKLVSNLGSTQAFVYVQKIGYGYTNGGAVSHGREYATLLDNNNVRRFVRFTGTGIALGAADERLNLSANAGFAAAAGRTASFMDLYRLDSDDLEITHYHDSDGVCELSAPFKAFSNTRAAPAVLLLPTPVDEMNDLPCGANNRGIYNVSARVNAGSTAANMKPKGVTISGFSPSDVIYLTQPTGQLYAGWSPWGNPGPPAISGSRGTSNRFWVIPDGNVALIFEVGDAGAGYAGYEAARSAFGIRSITGYSSYTFGIIDSPTGDNTGGVSLRIFVL